MQKNKVHVLILSMILCVFFANATTYYVKNDGNDDNTGLDWDNAYQTITKAMKHVSDNDEIWIAAGFYQEIYIIRVHENVTIYGGFNGTEGSLSERNIADNQVIIDGAAKFRCITNSGTLDGLYIQNGITDDSGAGIYNYSSGTIRNCNVYENATTGNNSLGGGIYNYGIVINCKVYGNTAKSCSGGIYNYSGTVENCTISNNSASFVAGGYNRSGAINNCTLFNNTAYNVGGIYNSSGTVTNCNVYANTSYKDGGGIYNSSGTVTNCTVYGNIAENESGGIHNSSGTVTNSIVWSNSTNDIYCVPENPGTISFSCFEVSKNVSGNNNISLHPQLVNTSGEFSTWDFHLQSSSPCIDIGTSTDAPVTDIEGTSRPKGNETDIGTYEYSSDCKAIFYADQRFGLSDLTVQFYDTSYGSPNSWAWDFNGDCVIDSHEENPEFIYKNPGCYTVSLTVSNEIEENSTTKTEYIFVGNRFFVSLTGNDENNGLSWGSALKTISKAISKTSAHDEVFVASGIYTEGSEITIPREVAVYGGFSGIETKISEREITTNKTIVNGDESYRCFYNKGTLNGFHVKKGRASTGGGIYNYGTVINCMLYYNNSDGIYNDMGTITNCIVFANTSGGIFNFFGIVTNCTVYANTDGSGIYNDSGTISNCIIWDNSPRDISCNPYKNGIVSFCCYQNSADIVGHDNINQNPRLNHSSGDPLTWDFHLQSSSPCINRGTYTDSPEADIEGTTRPQGNGIDMGAYEFSSECKALFYSTKRSGRPDLTINFYAPSYGNPDSWAWDFQGDGIIDSHEPNPQFVYQTPGHYTVSLTVSNGTQEDTETKTDYIYVAQNRYVNMNGNDEHNGQSWESAYQTIKKARDSAFDYDQIWIAAGVYQEEDTITISENISVYGGFSGTEINLIERDINTNQVIIDGNEKHRCITNAGTLDGLYICNGNESTCGGIGNVGAVINCTVYNNTAQSGSGIHNYGTVTDCIVYGNTATYSGGGIKNSYGTISNCTVYNNTAEDYGGGIQNSHGTIENCNVYNNKVTSSNSYGGGIYNHYGTITNCTVYNNTSQTFCGGIWDSLGLVTNCTVYDNNCTEFYGGIFTFKGTVANCMVYSNSARSTGGILNSSGSIINCTIYGNISEYQGGGITNDEGITTNCIAWGNSEPDIYGKSYSRGTVSYSCYETGENVSGSYNLFNQAPLFINTSGENTTWDFHLQSDSPCIDTGTSTDAPPTDIENTTRPQGIGIDIGAYEYVPTTNIGRNLWSIWK